MQAQLRYLPDPNRVGVLTATVLLSYALTHMVNAPGLTLSVQFPGFYFAYPVTIGTAMTLMASGLTASGMDWLLRHHPALQSMPPSRILLSERTLEHWLLPALTAFIIGVLLDILPSDSLWWVGLITGAALLVAVFVSEYVAVDPASPPYPFASAGLTALSYALFLIFIIALRIGGARLFIIVPAVFVASWLVVLRTLHLRMGGRWEYLWASGISVVCAQLSAGLHYWPLTSLQFGLVMLGPLYALTTLATNLHEDVPLRRSIMEPGVILGVLWVSAIFLH